MFRTLAVLSTLLLFATVANAQPGRLPLAPGVMPASPIGPGMPFTPAPSFNPGFVLPAQPGVPFTPGFTIPNQPNLMLSPILAPWGYPTAPFYGAGFGYPSAPFYGTGFGYPNGSLVAPSITVNQSLTVAPPLPRVDTVVLTGGYPATLTLQFPSAAEVWLNGKKVEGKAALERELTSPGLKAGESYTFDVKGRWTTGGKTYEAKRKATLIPGDRSRILVVSGEEVKEDK